MLRQIVKVALATRNMINKFNLGGASTKIEFLPGKDWFELTNTPGSFDFTEKTKTESPGVSFEQKLKCNYTRYGRMDDNQVHVWGKSDLFLRLEYNTGEIEIIGCPDFPTHLDYTFSGGKSSLYKFEFTCNTIYRPFSLLV